MSTDPLGEALGAGEPPAAVQPGQPAPPVTPQPGPAAGQPTAGPAYQAAPAYQPSSANDPQPAQPAWSEPGQERSLVERRPEILVGAALAGGFLAAQLLGRIRGR